MPNKKVKVHNTIRKSESKSIKKSEIRVKVEVQINQMEVIFYYSKSLMEK
jgi:hypothetical protein